MSLEHHSSSGDEEAKHIINDIDKTLGINVDVQPGHDLPPSGEKLFAQEADTPEGRELAQNFVLGLVAQATGSDPVATDPPPFTPVISTDYGFVDWREK